MAVALWIAAWPGLAADYTGTFAGNELTATLKASPGGYSGTIQLEGRSYPCTARAADGQLKGTFESEGHVFEFSARRLGDALTLESGGTTYRLQRQSPLVNPLARPAANPLAKPGADTPATRAAAPANRPAILRFKRVSVTDQPNMIGGHPGNFIAEGVWGATIGGGGLADATNAIFAPFGTIGGGVSNTIQDNA